MSDTLYIVVPCYNEEAVLPETARRLGEKLARLTDNGKISPQSRVLFVDDGSHDGTWSIIRSLHRDDPRFSGMALSRNRGHQNALLAGLMTAKDRADMVISMDADLQDDINAVDAMVDKYYEGCDIVYGVRSARPSDTAFKRSTAEGFYHLMNFLGAETVFNHADYRLMSRRALEALAQYKEANLFLRGIVPMIGYTTGYVAYERGERYAGESKYPLGKMLSFALEGITSLSVKPIRYITLLGFLVFLVSAAMLVYSVIRWAHGDTVIGWASVICSVWAIGGLILLSLGVIGEYIGKIYLESKHRPRFLVQTLLERENDPRAPEDAPATADPAEPRATEDTPATADKAEPRAAADAPTTADKAEPRATEDAPATADKAEPRATEDTPATADKAEPRATEDTPATADKAESRAPAADTAAQTERPPKEPQAPAGTGGRSGGKRRGRRRKGGGGG